jgi:hypothetical protein
MAKIFGPTNAAFLSLLIPALKRITVDTKLMTMHGLEAPAKPNSWLLEFR